MDYPPSPRPHADMENRCIRGTGGREEKVLENGRGREEGEEESWRRKWKWGRGSKIDRDGG